MSLSLFVTCMVIGLICMRISTNIAERYKLDTFTCSGITIIAVLIIITIAFIKR